MDVKIDKAKTDFELRELATSDLAVDVFAQAAYDRPLADVVLAQRPEMIRAAVLHHTILSVKTELHGSNQKRSSNTWCFGHPGNLPWCSKAVFCPYQINYSHCRYSLLLRMHVLTVTKLLNRENRCFHLIDLIIM